MLTTTDDRVFDKELLIFDQKNLNSHLIEIEINTLTTTQAFQNLEKEWNVLLEKSKTNSLFLSWEWMSTWWQFFAKNKSLHIFTARDADSQELLGIAPFVIDNQRSLTGLSEQNLCFLGNGKACPDHLDFIIKRDLEDRINALFTHAIWKEKNKWNQIKVDGLRSNSQAFYQLLYQQPQLTKKVSRTVCPYLSLPSSWKQLHVNFSKSMRYKLGRIQRRLKKDYPDTGYELVQVHQEDQLEPFFKILIDQHTASQRRKNNTGLFADQSMIDFHKALAKTLLKQDKLRAYTLRVGDDTIASLYCFQHNGVVSFYQSGFDQQWAVYSPGTLIMMHAIQAAIEEKNHTFDFLRGEEDYKFKWTKDYNTNLVFFIPLNLQNQIELQLKNISRSLFSRF